MSADEVSVAELLAHIQHHTASEFSYQETRKLELSTTAWQGQGRMLSGAEGSLVKLQLSPRRIIMASNQQQMYYWDAEQKQRHSGTVEDIGEAAEQITLLRSIMQGQMNELSASYNISAKKQGKQWYLRVSPKAEHREENRPTIEFSGDERNNKQRVIITGDDGESTEYQMQKTADGSPVEKAIQDLLREAKGE